LVHLPQFLFLIEYTGYTGYTTYMTCMTYGIPTGWGQNQPPIHGRQGALAEGLGPGDPTHAGHGQHVQDAAGRGKPVGGAAIGGSKGLKRGNDGDVKRETIRWCG
jgi:hypothetical protein